MLILTENMTFKEIAKFLSKDPTTISKEIKKHRIRKEALSFNSNFNQCINKDTCKKRNICSLACKKKCSTCVSCNKFCEDLKEELCISLQ